MKQKLIKRLQLTGNLLFSAVAIGYTASLYNVIGFDFTVALALVLTALIAATQMLIFFRRAGTFPAWSAMAFLFLIPLFLCKDLGTGLLIGATAIAIPLAVSFYWPPLRKIAPLAKWALPTAGGFLFIGTMGYSALHFDSFGFAPIQERIAFKWGLYVKEMEPMLQKSYPADVFKKMQPILDAMVKKEQAMIIAFTLLMMVVIAMFGIFFIAVFLADRKMKLGGEKRWCGSWSKLIPPRGVSWAYMLINLFCGFVPEKVYFPLNATVILFGFFYVFTALYKLERMLARRKLNGALRGVLIAGLFGAAYFTANAPMFSVYTILLFIGWWISTGPRVRVVQR